ncbi:MAG: SH3 domain-containing protein [Desulfobacteraceae bacterium]|nr:SH3 domain-containing protein [Desulfobacteraceae bacterium]
MKISKSISAIITAWFLSTIFMLLSACTQKLPAPGWIADLEEFPQNAGPYISHTSLENFFIPEYAQTDLANAYEARYFYPWDSPILPEEENPFVKIKRFEDKVLYGENLLPKPHGWLDEMKRHMDNENWPSMEKPAVTVHATALRMLPTVSPLFYNPNDPGEGFPFDYQQDSMIPAGTPLLVRHVSLNKDWYFVKAPWLSGWVRPNEIAWVDEDFIKSFRSGKKITFIQDEVPVFTEDGVFALHGRVGMILPLHQSKKSGEEEKLFAAIPLRESNGFAVLAKGVIPGKLTQAWPLPATYKNFQTLADGLIGKSYGWGGLYENRDCSALTQDIFAAFGIPLPRNSREQAQEGQWISLSGLSAYEKEKLIIEKALPLKTLLFMPGHVMLYLGQNPVSHEPAVIHSLWGLRTRVSGRTGRWIIGRTVITSLKPGDKLPHLARPDGLILERITGMSQICSP